jgi:hypothetical protein
LAQWNNPCFRANVPGFFRAEKLNGLPWIIDDKVLEILVVANSLGSVHSFRPFTVYSTSNLVNELSGVKPKEKGAQQREWQTFALNRK